MLRRTNSRITPAGGKSVDALAQSPGEEQTIIRTRQPPGGDKDRDAADQIRVEIPVEDPHAARFVDEDLGFIARRTNTAESSAIAQYNSPRCGMRR
jgi:hypothetical protein